MLTNYGPIFEVWFDGANGGDDYYGGAYETRSIDNTTYYDWNSTWQIVRELQPDACMFSDGGPDVRWVGNESGQAGDPCWATINGTGLLPGHAESSHLNRGDRDGTHWLPAEVDVSIRPGWFYHEQEDDAVKSASQLNKIYFESVGRGANLILNLPPDRRGLIHENDVAALRAWQGTLGPAFAADLAQGATATASNVRGGDERFSPLQVLSSQPDTYWSTDDDICSAKLVLEFGQPVTFNVVRLREYLPLGQRVTRIELDFWKESQWQESQWQEFAAATGIGSQRLVLTGFITTTKVRLRIPEATACPAIQEIGLFALSYPVEDFGKPVE